MMWFEYNPVAGTILHYVDSKGNSQDYTAYFSSPLDIVRTVASIINNNDITEITCAGAAWDLHEAVQQELARTYHYNKDIKFIKGE